MRAATARIPAACTPVAGALLGAWGLSSVLPVPSLRMSVVGWGLVKIGGTTPAPGTLELAVIA